MKADASHYDKRWPELLNAPGEHLARWQNIYLSLVIQMDLGSERIRIEVIWMDYLSPEPSFNIFEGQL